LDNICQITTKKLQYPFCKKFASEPALSSWLSGKNGEEKDFINYFVEFVELVNYDSLNG
jgi:hypothetical protein